MKKIVIMFLLIAMLLTAASCQRDKMPNTTEDIPNDQVSDHEEADNSESVCSGHFSPYFLDWASLYKEDFKDVLSVNNQGPKDVFIEDKYDVTGLFLQDLQQKREVRNMVLYPEVWEDGVESSMVDTLLIPTMKTDDWVCVRVAADKGSYYFWFFTKMPGEKLTDGDFSIHISTTPNSFAKRAERCGGDPTSEFIIEDSKYGDERNMYINANGQEIRVNFRTSDYSWSTPADVEQIVSFERYTFNNKNELVKVVAE